MTNTPRRPAGNTLAETLVAMTVLFLLTGMIALIYESGARSWLRMDRHSTASQEALKAAGRITQEVEQSVYDSLSVSADGRATSFLSAMDPTTLEFSLDPSTGRPKWQRYMILYHDPVSQELRQLEVPLVAGATEEDVPGPLESYDPGTGTRTLESYLSGGRVVSRGVSEFRFQGYNRMVVAEITCPGADGQTPVTLRSVTALRN